MTEEMIKIYEAAGFKRWQKNDMDRLYINATNMGLHVDFYKSGNIRSAWIESADGREEISNSEAARMMVSKTYVDSKTGALVAQNENCKRLAEQLIATL